MSEFAACRLYLVNEPPPDYEGDDWIKIVQPDEPDKPASGFADWLTENNKGLTLGNIQEYFSQYNSQCNEDGSVRIELQVHRSRADLEYTLITSYGVLEGPYQNEEQVKTTVEVEGETSYVIQRELAGGVKWSWDGPVVVGNSIAQAVPQVVQQGQILGFGDKEVSGTLRLEYTQSPETWFLVLMPREQTEYDADDPEGAYKATVRAVWAGEPVSHEVDLPDMEGNCLHWGTQGSVNPEDPDDPDDPDGEKCYIRKLLLDPCTYEKESDRLVQTPCSGDK